jgi:hypothetical protein
MKVISLKLVTAVLVACAALHSAPAFAQNKRLLAMGEEKGYRHEAVSHAMAVIERVGAKQIVGYDHSH